MITDWSHPPYLSRAMFIDPLDGSELHVIIGPDNKQAGGFSIKSFGCCPLEGMTDRTTIELKYSGNWIVNADHHTVAWVTDFFLRNRADTSAMLNLTDDDGLPAAKEVATTIRNDPTRCSDREFVEKAIQRMTYVRRADNI